MRSVLKLGVNIDHAATLREARYRGLDLGRPRPGRVTCFCAYEAAGAARDHGPTCAKAPPHILQDRDVWKLREVIKTRLNLDVGSTRREMAATPLKLKPAVVCLVP